MNANVNNILESFGKNLGDFFAAINESFSQPSELEKPYWVQSAYAAAFPNPYPYWGAPIGGFWNPAYPIYQGFYPEPIGYAASVQQYLIAQQTQAALFRVWLEFQRDIHQTFNDAYLA